MNRYLLSSLLSAFVLGACTQTPAPSDTMEPQSDQTTQESSLDSAMPATGTSDAEEMMAADDSTSMASRTLNIDMFSFGYSQETINAKPGETITLTLTATDAMHDFVIDELNVKSAVVQSGNSTTVAFTIPQSAAGQSYEYYCSVGQHRANGMVGTLIVE